jgi:hypothetical protein
MGQPPHCETSVVLDFSKAYRRLRFKVALTMAVILMRPAGSWLLASGTSVLAKQKIAPFHPIRSETIKTANHNAAPRAEPNGSALFHFRKGAP